MATVEVTGEETPLSLYIDLAKGQRADMEVASRAAIAWSRMIREAAFLTDPFLDVRVEFISGTEGSLNLNSMIRAVQDVARDPKKLKAIAAAVALFFAAEAGSWAIGKGFDALWEWAKAEVPELVEDLTDDIRTEVEQIIDKITQSRSTQAKAQKVYAELEHDSSVTGVGVSFVPGTRPSYIVPRSEFSRRAGEIEVKTETTTTRVKPSRETLTLVSPALSDDESKWRFRKGERALWAIMDDEDMRARIRPGSNSAPKMLIGIQMEVDMETAEELQPDGTWKVTEHRIQRVRTMKEPTTQADWIDSPPDRK